MATVTNTRDFTEGAGDASTAKKKKVRIHLLPGDKASDIVAPAVVEGNMVRFYLSIYLKKFILLLFYPNDFPILCGDELKEFSERVDEFRDLDCEIVAVSTDSHFAHLAYVRSPEKAGGLGGSCAFPLVSDKTLEISRKYKMLHEPSHLCYRGSVLVDPHGRVVLCEYHDFNLHRRVDRLLNVVMAHRILVGQSNQDRVCYIPEGWKPGEDILVEKKTREDEGAGGRMEKMNTKAISNTQTSVRLLVGDDDSKKMRGKVEM